MPNQKEGDDLEKASTMVLLDRAKAGSTAARDVLYQRYLPRLKRWARGRIPIGARGLHETDDIVQDVLMRTLHKVDQFDPQHSGAFLAYMRRAVRNRIAEVARSPERRRRVELSDEEFPDSGPSPLQSLIEADNAKRFDEALERLGPVEQAAIIARGEWGMSYDEIARELGKPSTDAARMTVNRAVARLAQEMADLRRA